MIQRLAEAAPQRRRFPIQVSLILASTCKTDQYRRRPTQYTLHGLIGLDQLCIYISLAGGCTYHPEDKDTRRRLDDDCRVCLSILLMGLHHTNQVVHSVASLRLTNRERPMGNVRPYKYSADHADLMLT